MAWTSPLTATANGTLTAAQYNTHARDNFLEMEPAKATAFVRTATTQTSTSSGGSSGSWCRPRQRGSSSSTAVTGESFCTFISTGLNAIAERAWKSSIVQKTGEGQSTTSTAYTDLTTFGPSVTVNTGTKALCFFSSIVGNETVNTESSVSVAVTGNGVNIAADDDWRIEFDGHTAYAGSNDDNTVRRTNWKLFTGLVPGTNTFTMKYKVSAGTGRFNYRHLLVWAL